MSKTSLPQGMHDKLFKRALGSYEIEHMISDLLINEDFYRIELPTVEHFEVFGNQVKPNHYNFFGKDGELLTLRPDMTSQVGRLVASTQLQPPIKFSYSGKVFRYQEGRRGLENEGSQAGIEVVGFPAQSGMKEALSIAQKSLDTIGLSRYRFEFSHAQILETIFENLNVSNDALLDLKEAIAEKHITRLYSWTKNYPSDFDNFIRELPYLFGESQIVLERAKKLTDNQQLLQVLDELADDLLEFSLGKVNVDLAQVPTMPYYTGIMFRVFDEKLPDAFLSGGRYDKLFEYFGYKELTAIGWAIDIDAVYQAIHDKLTFKGGDLG